MSNTSGALSGAASGAATGATVGGPWGAVIGGAIGLGASLLGGNDHSAEDRLKTIQALYQQLQDPNFDMSSLTPQQKAVAAQLTPEMMQAIPMADPKTVEQIGQAHDAQMGALSSLQQMGKGGLNLQDQSDLMKIQNGQAAANKGQQDAILANANARGVGGGGAELAARMAAQQGAADSAASQGTQVAANAQARALQALQASGQAGAQISAQDIGVQKDNANNINQFNQANFANQQGIANQNVANRNAAQGFNVSNQQNVANSNTDTNNAFMQYNQQNQNNLKQQQFGNDYAKVQGQAGIAAPIAKYMDADSAAKDEKTQGIGQALGSFAQQGIASLGSGTPSSGVPANGFGSDDAAWMKYAGSK